LDPPSDLQAGLRAQALVRRFGGIAASDHIDLALAPGERCALIGPNGAGKTTLVNLLTGVARPDSGRIFLRGEDITALAPAARVRRGLVRTFQINQLFGSMSSLQTVRLALAQRGRRRAGLWRALASDRALTEEACALLERMRLLHVMHQPVMSLAYGKRRLLELATALACDPAVLLLDEPVAGIAASEREEILATLQALPARMSILLIEHDMSLVFRFAQRIVVLVDGRVLTQGSPQAIAQDAAVSEVYLGRRGVPAAGAPSAGQGSRASAQIRP
jgi:branched-chain amino acid transport system ATP-binding protein